MAIVYSWKYRTAETDPFSSSKDSYVWGIGLHQDDTGVCTGDHVSSWHGMGVAGDAEQVQLTTGVPCVEITATEIDWTDDHVTTLPTYTSQTSIQTYICRAIRTCRTGVLHSPVPGRNLRTDRLFYLIPLRTHLIYTYICQPTLGSWDRWSQRTGPWMFTQSVKLFLGQIVTVIVPDMVEIFSILLK